MNSPDLSPNPRSGANPFAGLGAMVCGQRFVGRARQLEMIRSLVLGENFGNVSIMGLPRVGKTSLAYQAVQSHHDELLTEGTITCSIGMSSCDNALTFYHRMVSDIEDDLRELIPQPRAVRLEQKLERLAAEDDPGQYKNYLLDLLRFVRRNNLKLIYILDEFDHVQSYFDVPDFQLLRECAYQPELKICLITISRKSLKEIEPEEGSISNFFNIFSAIRLGMFDEEDLSAYYARVSDVYAPDDDFKALVNHYVGRHPFLLDCFNRLCYERGVSSASAPAFPELLQSAHLELEEHFDTMRGTLTGEGLWDAAVQLVVGPNYNVTRLQTQRLLNFEFLRPVPQAEKDRILGRSALASVTPDEEPALSAAPAAASREGAVGYVCFCDYFTELLSRESLEGIPFWNALGEAERNLRTIITQGLCRSFGTDWEQPFVSRVREICPPKIQETIRELQKRRDSAQREYSHPSRNIVDYTYTRHIYVIFMRHFWDEIFAEVLGADRKAWIDHLKHLSFVRNPPAHNNPEFISPLEIEEAERICLSIAQALKSWQSAHQA